MFILRKLAIWIISVQVGFILIGTFVYSYQKIWDGKLTLYQNQLEEAQSLSEALKKMEKNLELQQVKMDKLEKETGNKQHPSSLPATYELQDDDGEYFESIGNLTCFIEGTNLTATRLQQREWASTCICLQGYHGDDCGIPDAAWFSCLSVPCFPSKLRPRTKPRRIIHGFNINHEKEFLEIRMKELADVVDVFIVGESNVTAGGDPKPLFILPELEKGFLKEYQKKMIYVLQDHFPAQGFIDGWFADTYLRDYMGQKGLERIHGIRDDDLFLLLDADEIPKREVLLFLKLYDGYPEPIAFVFRWSVYGFFWKKRGDGKRKEDVTRVVAVASMNMIRRVYENRVMAMRRNHVTLIFGRLMSYQASGKDVYEWTIGTEKHYAGFHCSWCYKPEGIRWKLQAAQKDDKPRWGDFPEKLRLDYISALINKGEWFDGSRPFVLVDPASDSYYAPRYVLEHNTTFSYLLYKNQSAIIR